MRRALGGVSAERRLGVEANMIKIRGTELHQLLTELRMEALGYYAEPYVLSALLDGWYEPPVGPAYAIGATPSYLHFRTLSLFSGSNVIPHNLIPNSALLHIFLSLFLTPFTNAPLLFLLLLFLFHSFSLSFFF